MIDIENPSQLRHYLQQTGRIAAKEQVSIKQLAGGVSNRTMLVERKTGNDWVVKQALEKLRVQVDWFSEPERIHREGAGLRALTLLLPEGATPTFLFENFDEHILAMSAIPQPHENWKTRLLAGNIDTEFIQQFGKLLGMIHSRAQTLSEAEKGFFADQHFFETLRIEPYYRYSAQMVPEAREFIEQLIGSLQKQTLVHGDYSPKNILIYGGSLILLDHEVIHWGDPAFDVGFSMTHLLSKAHYVMPQRNDFQNAAHLYWKAYAHEITEMPWYKGVEQRAVHHTLGCLLARVSGRSQLEYLSTAQRDHQRHISLELMKHPPIQMPTLIDEFIERL